MKSTHNQTSCQPASWRGGLHRAPINNRFYKWLTILLLLSLCAVDAAPALGTPGSSLALTLQAEGHPRSAAIEWRRLALHAPDPDARASYYWAAAYQYLQADDPALAEKMLDAAENASWDIEPQALLLRAQAASQRNDRNTAQFYWRSIKRAKPTPEAERMARQRLATYAIQAGDLPQARTLLLQSPANETHALEALAQFEQGHDKSPRVGGLLGMIPGLGYAYAGEYANAFRSLILNSIFIYGMVDTAQKDQWGAFAAITFFELTWYSGSIYGGIDASHRYNQHRRNQLYEDIQGNAHITPDWNAIPQITLQFTF
ncbi:MAG: tetratricopeptide repeat protein [Kiritimatiellia bacterium]